MIDNDHIKKEILSIFDKLSLFLMWHLQMAWAYTVHTLTAHAQLYIRHMQLVIQNRNTTLTMTIENTFRNLTVRVIDRYYPTRQTRKYVRKLHKIRVFPFYCLLSFVRFGAPPSYSEKHITKNKLLLPVGRNYTQFKYKVILSKIHVPPNIQCANEGKWYVFS